ncbi:hypothetical protein JAAARDRAFT_495400 [Jaapia argillacea MUCL 33604]|uniref:Uncharacterized protein n=1 Tax=Jaapia argillacea MUCL 33604 TaxID=933084 RepID=A0A067PAB7_9AGAM|nr:hypothetical protein JAAARDRAFT_495400 [Jaapia argillacea MUCL 33604]
MGGGVVSLRDSIDVAYHSNWLNYDPTNPENTLSRLLGNPDTLPNKLQHPHPSLPSHPPPDTSPPPTSSPLPRLGLQPV